MTKLVSKFSREEWVPPKRKSFTCDYPKWLSDTHVNFSWSDLVMLFWALGAPLLLDRVKSVSLKNLQKGVLETSSSFLDAAGGIFT